MSCRPAPLTPPPTLSFSLSFLMPRPPPSSTLFPYTTLFRSLVDSLIDDYGGNLFNIDGIADRVHVNVADVRQQTTMNYLVRDRRSEEHTSELQSRGHLVCRLLLEKKKKKKEQRELRQNEYRL